MSAENHIIIIGAGYIGVEFACIFNMLGASGHIGFRFPAGDEACDEE